MAATLPALQGHSRRTPGQPIGLKRAVGVVAHGGAELRHRRGCLLQASGLLLGARAQVAVALDDLDAGGGHVPGADTHLAHGIEQ
ncbi:MAG: hypothetical protein ING89_07775 [Rubrivivax sp.]|nr:hypothetical protein [Rubrivivax sp.]